VQLVRGEGEDSITGEREGGREGGGVREGRVGMTLVRGEGEVGVAGREGGREGGSKGGIV